MINKVILVGNVGIDPEVRTTESGTKVARVRLATTERVFDRQANEAKEYTEWHTVVLWRGLADVVDRFVHKGSQLYIEGSLRTREWTDRDNQKRYSTEIVANEMKLLGRREGGQQGGQSDRQNGGQSYQPQGGRPSYQQNDYQQQAQPAPQPASQPVTPPAEDPDDLPF